jgi:hypothetical protein
VVREVRDAHLMAYSFVWSQAGVGKSMLQGPVRWIARQLKVSCGRDVWPSAGRATSHGVGGD